jgi:large subunit ribosomal protein L30
MAAAASGKLKITQVRSTIGTKPKQRGTLRALGLKRINHTVELPDRPEIRGMVARVPHLVSVEPVVERPRRSTPEETPPAASTNGGVS